MLRVARECIAENGIAGATASEIARRCDLSWGVIQYHFGDRVGLFLALLESGMESLAGALQDLRATGDELEPRVRALVLGTWALMRSDDYRVTLEVQLQLGRVESHRARVRKLTRQLRARLQELWRKALADLPADRVDRAERLATITLRGLALERALEGGRAAHDADLEDLVESLSETLTPNET